MKENIKTIWVEALRSGDYLQGTGALRSTDEDTEKVTHCCLGVLCDLHRKITKKKGWKNDTYLGEGGYLPDAVIKWSGIGNHAGEFHYKNGNKETLAVLNDDKRSFQHIANVIEKYF